MVGVVLDPNPSGLLSLVDQTEFFYDFCSLVGRKRLRGLDSLSPFTCLVPFLCSPAWYHVGWWEGGLWFFLRFTCESQKASVLGRSPDFSFFCYRVRRFSAR
jgi:hypothetical protein